MDKFVRTQNYYNRQPDPFEMMLRKESLPEADRKLVAETCRGNFLMESLLLSLVWRFGDEGRKLGLSALKGDGIHESPFTPAAFLKAFENEACFDLDKFRRIIREAIDTV